MRKVLALGGVVVVLLAAAALAGVGLPEQARGEAGITRTITVNGTGTVEARPDLASFSFGVETRAATAKEASADNARAMRRLIDALKGAGIDKDDLQTEQVTVWPATEPGGGVNGYTASGSVRVETAVDRAGGLVDTATAAGATTVWGPTLTRTESHALEEQALERALADARRKAKSLAAAADAQLGEVVKVVEGGAVEPVLYRTALAEAKDVSTPIEPGTTETTATLTVTFAMK